MDTERGNSMRVYVAGPYTSEPGSNVHKAIKTAQRLVENGHTPFVPHLFHLWHMIVPGSYEQWIALDLEWLRTCKALVRLPGESSGADREVAEALRLGITVYFSIDDFLLKNANLEHPAPPAGPTKIVIPVQEGTGEFGQRVIDRGELNYKERHFFDRIEHLHGKVEGLRGRVNALGDSHDEYMDRFERGFSRLQAILNMIIFSLGSDLTGMQNKVCRVCRKIWDTHCGTGTFVCPEVSDLFDTEAE